ncbi:MAG: GNAT family N-acetyltransferase [Candidatus Hodarchaeales archaeon]
MATEDIPEVRNLWLKVGFVLSFSDTIPEVKRMLSHNPDLCLVGYLKDNKIIAAVLGGFDGRRGWVHHLAVHPDMRRLGYGKKIMSELTNRFKKMKIAKIKLEILDVDIDVLHFYKKIGWDVRPELTTMSLTLIN